MAAAAFTLSMAVPAHATIQLDSYTLNFSAGATALGMTAAQQTAAGIADLTHVDEMQFLANSFVGFHDNDASASISVGDTFSDYIAVRFTGMTDVTSTALTPMTYGAGPGRTHEITSIFKADGHQTSANTYKIDALTNGNMYFDAGAGFTKSDFSNIATFGDGVVTEHQDLIRGGGVNFDAVLPNGTISLITAITDDLHNNADANNEYWELDDNGDPLNDSLLFPGVQLVMGVIDANNLMDDAVFGNAIASYFGIDIGIQNDAAAPPNATPGAFYTGGDFSFGFTTKSDGSFNKALQGIPEPSTVVLMGLGLIGLAGAGYRRRNN